jgi:DNA-binding CsgD family transcriptional regulator
MLIIFLFNYVFKQQEKRIKIRQEKRFEEERRKFEEQQRLQSMQHQLELERSEKVLMQLKNEKLESELASSAMSLVQKTEFLNRIKDEMNKLKKADTPNIDTGEIKKILRGIADENRLDEEWEQFSIHFNKVHNNFLLNLKNRVPDLKAHELKLCAYLRMNLSSKEIARLLSISVRGVEINRYRLRKKLQLKPREDLFEFLMNIDLDNAGRLADS